MQPSTAGVPDADKRLTERLRFAPDTGHIMLFDQRMLLMHGFSMAELRRELVERLGSDMARGVFTRLGYQQGLADHRRVRDAFGDDVATAVSLGPRLRDMEGYVRNTPLEVRFNQDAGEFFGDFTWTSSWEAEAHLQQFGISGSPACWMNVGYATAFATSAFGRPLLVREVECVAMGHARCRAVIRPVAEWPNAETDLHFMQVEDFVDPPMQRRAAEASAEGEVGFEAVSPLEHELVGASTAFNSVVYLLKRVGQTDATVLFLGESGVGKERFSRALHQIGPRAAGPFVSLNCAAIPHDLVEAELFGVDRGAFTGASVSRPGRFERAHGGTLFLDEIGSLPLHAQGKLLRALQEREVERVGGSQLRKVDVRIVAATNEDLRRAVAEGRFRADLFFRLNVFPIRIPPLRDRREDIPLMLGVFVERFGQRFGKRIRGITRNALDALWHYDWPGNVRELENMVERAVILADTDGALDVHHLFSGGEVTDWQSFSVLPSGDVVARGDGMAARAASGDAPDTAAGLLAGGRTLADIEEAVIRAALERHGGKLAPAARELGLGRGQMQYRVARMRRRTTSPG